MPTNSNALDYAQFARVDLCHQPTPIEPMERLQEQLSAPQLFIKRDDCTGLATGGNKTRKLEFLLGEALLQGADTLVTQGAVQSNHVRQTAAAACKFGLKCHALLERRVADAASDYESTGNVFLDELFGATLEFRPAGLDMNAEAEALCQRLRADGAKPYFIPGGGSNAIGALGYASCAQEIGVQSHELGIDFDYLVVASGSAGTHAGLLAGLQDLALDLPVLGISVRHPQAKQVAAVHTLAEETLALLNDATLPIDKVIVDDGYVGPGYGVAAESTLEAIRMTARSEAILLDPVYSAKAMAGLIGLVRSGFFAADAKVLFLHTGGSAALFAYEEILRS